MTLFYSEGDFSSFESSVLAFDLKKSGINIKCFTSDKR